MGEPRFVSVVAGMSLVAIAGTARAGALMLPGVGPSSTMRAGAWVADADDPTAIAINPAGLAKQWGTVIYLGGVFLDYSLEFTRRGTYNAAPESPTPLPWAGQAYPTVKDTSHPPIGFGPFQALPLVAVSTDLGLHIKGLRFGAGVYVPNSYPTRDMQSDYVMDDPNRAPPPTRYDVIKQEAAIIFPSIAIAYRASDKLDIGVRFSPANANVDAITYTWGQPNPEEWTGKDSLFHVKASDGFVPVLQAGALYRPNDTWELGASFQTETDVHAKGTGTAQPSAHLAIAGQPVTIDAITTDGDTDSDPTTVVGVPKCADHGTGAALKGCVDLALPMIVSAGARYIGRDDSGREKFDVEYDVQWEHWSAVSDYKVVVDGAVLGSIILNPTFIRHGLQDTFSGRVGGSYHVAPRVSVQGGVAYDTKAARDSWERVDLDGAARTTVAGGFSIHLDKVRVDAGLAYAYEGTRTQGSDCDPQAGERGCAGDGSQTPVDQRKQPDPIIPISSPMNQQENPINSGTIKSGYFLFTLAAVYHF